MQTRAISRNSVNCHLCDILVTREHSSAEWEAPWLTKCSESLAQVMDIEGFDPAFFDAATYCPSCITLIADVDFSVRAASSLSSRISSLRTQIAAFLLKQINFAEPNAIESDTTPQESPCLLYTDANFKVKVDIAPYTPPEECDTMLFPDNIDDSLGNWPTRDQSHSEELLVQPNRNLRSRTRIVYQDDTVSDSDCDDSDINSHGDDEWTLPHDKIADDHEDTSRNDPTITTPKRKRKGTSMSRNRNRCNTISAEPRSKRNRSRSHMSKKSNITEHEFLNQMKDEVYFWKRSDKELETILLEFVRNSLPPTTTIDGQISEELLVYLLRSEIEEHHQLANTYICTVSGCPARFKNIRNLTRHLLVEHGVHLDPSPFQCFECQTLCSFDVELDAHLRRNHGGDPRPFHCEVSGCFRDFIGNSKLSKHMRLKHPEVEAEVGMGSKKKKYHEYRDVDAMSKEPFLRSRGRGAKCQRKFPCIQSGCHYRAQSELMLCFHLLDSHPNSGAQPYECQSCRKGFKNLKTYQMHPCLRAGHQCEECGKVFYSQFRLTRHKKLRHKDMAGFRCSVCAWLYFQPEDVATHEKLHTPETAFNCVLSGCQDPSFETVEDLRAHVTGPSHDVTKSVKVCDHCGYMSKGVYSVKVMKQHMRTHTGEQPLKCRFCDKRFKTGASRISHEQINHPDLVEKKIYACKLCDATFTVAQYLFKHNAWHKYGKNACRPVAKKR